MKSWNARRIGDIEITNETCGHARFESLLPFASGVEPIYITCRARITDGRRSTFRNDS